MPFIVMPDEAVGVIHQACHSLVMESLAVRGRGNCLIEPQQFLRIFQIAVFFFFCPGFHSKFPLFYAKILKNGADSYNYYTIKLRYDKGKSG
jgi:hypothetical protein